MQSLKKKFPSPWEINSYGNCWILHYFSKGNHCCKCQQWIIRTAIKITRKKITLKLCLSTRNPAIWHHSAKIIFYLKNFSGFVQFHRHKAFAYRYEAVFSLAFLILFYYGPWQAWKIKVTHCSRCNKLCRSHQKSYRVLPLPERQWLFCHEPAVFWRNSPKPRTKPELELIPLGAWGLWTNIALHTPSAEPDEYHFGCCLRTLHNWHIIRRTLCSAVFIKPKRFRFLLFFFSSSITF